MDNTPPSRGMHIEPLSTLLQNENEFGGHALLKTPRCVKTGFPALDRLLGGGLSPGLTVLGASPGLGKSTLALNIAEYACRNGTPVRYYSYEMPPRRLGMKLIARENFCAGGHPLFSAKDLFGTDKLSTWTDTWDAYQRARQQVAARIDSLYIVDCNAGGSSYTAEDIQSDFQRFMEEQGPEGAMPLLIVDYLQIMPLPAGVRISDTRQAVDYNVRNMTALSKSFGGVPVLLISSLGRTSYKVPVQIDSFKESGSIEFSADTLLGLQFSACQNPDGSTNKDWNMSCEKDKVPREMDLVVLKQRYGETGKLPLLYYAPYDCFTQRETPFHILQADEPFEEYSIAPAMLSFSEKPAPSLAVPAHTIQEPLLPATVPPAEYQTQLEQPAGMPEDAPAKVERPRTIGLEKVCFNNTMIAHELRRGNVTVGEEQPFCVLPSKGIQTTFFRSADLVCSDCDVADALYSLFLTEKYFSPRDGFSLHRLLTVLTGDSRQTLTPQKRSALLSSLARLQQTNITIGCKEELDVRNKDRKYRNVSFDAPRSFLMLSEYGGKYYFPSVELLDVLPLYEYASMTGQIISVPMRLLDVRDTEGNKPFRDTAAAISIKHFLLYRLEVVRNKKSAMAQHQMRTIAFKRGAELFQILRMRRDGCTNTEWARRCRRIRQIVILTLDYFKRLHYISDYTTREEDSITIVGPVADPWMLEYDL